jgi:hypothetical protein
MAVPVVLVSPKGVLQSLTQRPFVAADSAVPGASWQLSSGRIALPSRRNYPKTTNFGKKLRFLRIFIDVFGETAIIIIAFSFFAPAFLFLLPSLRKKAGVFKF